LAFRVQLRERALVGFQSVFMVGSTGNARPVAEIAVGNEVDQVLFSAFHVIFSQEKGRQYPFSSKAAVRSAPHLLLPIQAPESAAPDAPRPEPRMVPESKAETR